MTTPAFKRCKRCQQVKPASEFAKHYQAVDGLRTNCRKCNVEIEVGRGRTPEGRAKQRERRQSPEYQAYIKEYRQRPEVKVRKQLLRNQPDKKAVATQYNRSPKAVDSRKRYSQSEHGKLVMTVKTRRRRAKRRGLPAEFTASDWQRTLDYFGGRCAVCGRPPGLWHTIAADHWIPLASPDCPGTVPWNIVPLCHGDDGCNNHKQDKEAERWLIERFGKAKAAKILQCIREYFEWVQNHVMT